MSSSQPVHKSYFNLWNENLHLHTLAFSVEYSTNIHIHFSLAIFYLQSTEYFQFINIYEFWFS